MKALVLGWVRMSGKAKQNDKPYDFAELVVAQPFQASSSDRMQRIGDGLEPSKISLRAGAEGQFKGLKFPCELELTIDHTVNRFNRLEPEVTGFVRPASARSA